MNYSVDEINAAKTNIKIRNQIIQDLLPMVRRMVSKYNRSVQGDLINESVFGIIDAIEQFDSQYLAKFQTYAYSKIRDRISRFLYKENRTPFVFAESKKEIESNINALVETSTLLNYLDPQEKFVIEHNIMHEYKFGEIQQQQFQNKSTEYVRQLKLKGLRKLQQLITEGVIIKYTPVVSQILGQLPINIINSLYYSLSYEIENHQFTDKYITGRWDGKKYLFSKNTLKFRSGLIFRVVEILTLFNLPYRIESSPYANPLNGVRKHNDHLPNLRDYQIQATEAIAKFKRGGINLPPRTGKTIIAANIINYINETPTMFTCFSLEIAIQTKQKLEHWLQTEIGFIGDGIVDVKPITVATIQSLLSVYNQKYDFAATKQKEKDIDQKHIVRNLVETTKLAICDEYHHYSSASATFVLGKMKQAHYLVGLSATPYRNYGPESILLERNIGPIIFKRSYSEMIQRGYLLKPHIYIYSIPKVAISRHYQAVYREAVVENDLRNQIIRKNAQILASQGKSVAIIISQIKHGEIIKKLIPGSILLTGREDTQTRQSVLSDLQNKRRLIVISTLLNEGVDIASLDAVIIAAAGKSTINTMQRMRCLTPFEGKTKGIVIDFFDKDKFLIKQSRERFKQYAYEPEFEVKFRKVISDNGALKLIEEKPPKFFRDIRNG